jgi:hypothetical protein
MERLGMTVKGMQLTDQDLIDAEYRSFFYTGPDNLYSAVFDNNDMKTFVAPTYGIACVIAREYGFRLMNEAKLITIHRIWDTK